MKRKAHYNEYYAVKLARKLLEEEDDDEDEDETQSQETNKPGCSRSGANGSQH